MNNANDIIRRTTCNGFSVTIENGQLCHAGGTFTRHAGVCMADALELAEAIGMFDRAEMPSLMAAASKLAKRGPLSLWPLVKETARLSHLAGTRPADMPRPTETMTQATESEVMTFVAEIQATERAQALDLAIMRGAYVAPATTGIIGLAIAAKLAAKSARK